MEIIEELEKTRGASNGANVPHLLCEGRAEDLLGGILVPNLRDLKHRAPAESTCRLEALICECQHRVHRALVMEMRFFSRAKMEMMTLRRNYPKYLLHVLGNSHFESWKIRSNYN